MKGKFIVPKIGLLILLLGFLAQEFVIADRDLKQGQKDKIEVRDVQPDKSADVQPPAPAPIAYSQTGEAPTLNEGETEAPAPQEADNGGFLGYLKDNLVETLVILLGVAEFLVRFTKTEKDNSILNFIKSILDAIIPNRRLGGGTH